MLFFLFALQVPMDCEKYRTGNSRTNARSLLPDVHNLKFCTTRITYLLGKSFKDFLHFSSLFYLCSFLFQNFNLQNLYQRINTSTGTGLKDWIDLSSIYIEGALIMNCNSISMLIEKITPSSITKEDSTYLNTYISLRLSIFQLTVGNFNF